MIDALGRALPGELAVLAQEGRQLQRLEVMGEQHLRRRGTWKSMWRCAASPMTEKTFRSMLGKHVLPALGKLPLAAVGREQVTELHHRLCGTPTTANMAIAMLSHMFTMAEGWGLVPEGTNPCKYVVKYPDAQARALSDRRGV